LNTENIVATLEKSGRRIETSHLGCRTVWRSWGKGPPLVLLHGGHGSWSHWIRNIAHFASTRTVLAADMIGYGESDDLPRPHSIPAIAEHTSAGLEQLLNGERFDLIGFSFGTFISGYLARYHGTQIGHLLLTGVNGFALGITTRFVPDFRNWKQFDTPEGRREAHRHNLQALMIADPKRIDELAVDLQATNTSRARVRSIDLPHAGMLVEAMENTQVPPLSWIYGERDVTIQDGIGARTALIHAHFPGTEVAVIPAAGHWVQYEAPDAFHAIVDRMLERKPVVRPVSAQV
jgi:pimeloyl-ACP methyl ester carboxylesterase